MQIHPLPQDDVVAQQAADSAPDRGWLSESDDVEMFLLVA